MSDIEMSGKDAPHPTIFGVIGKTKETNKTKTLGGLVQKAPTPSPIPKTIHVKNDNKTKVAKSHYGQILYPGKFMAVEGERLK